MADSSAPVAGTEHHPQARMTLSAALAGHASHAYLFHGPAGVGKRTAARAFAAELLAAGAGDVENARHRAIAGTHPDLTWVRPTGAHVMRTDDVAAPVVSAATRTPFESEKRVFVLERVDTMNDEVANRLLKTLEEPPPFVHLILLTDSLGQVLPTVISRCQLVRFDPLPAARIAEDLVGEGVPAELAGPCARLALGSAARARLLASAEGAELRADVDRLVAVALAGGGRPAGEPEAWRGLLERAEQRRAAAEERVAEEGKARLASEPKGRERGAIEKQFEEAAKRDGRRARTEILDLGLTLAALRFRDLLCLAEGAGDAALDHAGAAALLTGAQEGEDTLPVEATLPDDGPRPGDGLQPGEGVRPDDGVRSDGVRSDGARFDDGVRSDDARSDDGVRSDDSVPPGDRTRAGGGVRLGARPGDGARDPRRLRVAAERCEQARLSLELNVTEDLALEALGFRLARLVGPAA